MCMNNAYCLRWWLRFLQETLSNEYEHNPSPKLVTLFIGANDAALPSSVQHVPLIEYKENLKRMIDTIQQTFSSTKAEANTKLVLLTPGAIDNAQQCPDRTNETAATYAKVCMEAGNECGVDVIDVWTPMQQDIASYLIDGLHLSAKGNILVFELLMQYIDKHAPELSPERMPLIYPYWRDLLE